MKLLNKSLIYLSIILFVIVSLWTVVFYFNMLREIKESVDEGLENYKRQIIYKAETDSSIILKINFEEGFYCVNEIPAEVAIGFTDQHVDTMMYMQDSDDESPELEPIRMLKTVFVKDGKFYELKIINSMVEEDDLVKELLTDAIGLYLVLLISLILINNLVLQRLWKPFYAFLFKLKNYRLGANQVNPSEPTNVREFTDLQSAVEALLLHGNKSFEQQKQFIGNAAHELQTPLAIAMNKLELLLEKGNLEEQQAESIAEVLAIIERLIRLNKSLLLLTKIENKQFFDNQKISIHAIVQQIVQDLEDVAEFKNVRFALDKKSDLFVQMDPALANIVISNLIRNAIFHNITGGLVKVEIGVHSLKISNTGATKALEQEKLFTRFYKSEQSAKGTGLGLAIVKAIIQMYGFSISYGFENNLHTFEIQFPVK